MFKVIGLMGLVISAGILGIMKTLSLKERVSLLEEYLSLVLQIKSQISYFKEPLTTIFSRLNFDDTSCSKASSLFKNVEIKLKSTDEDIREIWEEEIDSAYGRSHLTEVDIKVLKLPGGYIGQTDFKNQQSQFSYTEDRLKEQIGEAKEDYRVKGKLYNRIGFFIGGIIAIILI